MDSLLQAFQQFAKAEMAMLRRRRNALAPISKLPTEISVAIFARFLERGEHVELADPPSRISTLSEVCSAWNKLVNNTPGLWSRIRTDYPPKFIRKALENSEEHLITIDGALSDPDDSRQEAILASCSQIGRWSSAKLEADSDEEVDLVTYSGAPVLRRLELSCLQRGTEDRAVVNLCAGHAPLLEHLSLTGLDAVWTSPIFKNLRTLALNRVLGLQSGQLSSILKACPQLRRLSFQDVRLSDRLPPTGQDPTPIDLLDLEGLEVTGHSPEVLDQLVARVHCPIVNTVKIRIPTPAPHHPPHQISLDLRLVGAFALKFLQRAALQTLPSIISCQGRSCAIMFFRQEVTSYQLSFESGRNNRGLRALLEQIRRAFTLPSTAIVFPSADEFESAWKGLSDLQDMDFLHISGQTDCLAYLATPLERDGALHWPFSRLKTFSLGGTSCERPGEIVTMVQGRQGRMLADSDVPVELPSTLRSLFIGRGCSMDGVTVMRLKVMLPETKVTWNAEGLTLGILG